MCVTVLAWSFLGNAIRLILSQWVLWEVVSKELREKKSRIFFSDVLCRSAKEFCVTMSILKVTRAKLRDNDGWGFDWECFATIVCVGIDQNKWWCLFLVVIQCPGVVCYNFCFMTVSFLTTLSLRNDMWRCFFEGLFCTFFLRWFQCSLFFHGRPLRCFTFLFGVRSFHKSRDICALISSFEMRCFSSVFASPR